MANILKRIIRTIEDERLKRLIKEVWGRIPAPERDIIDQRLSGIYDRTLEYDALPAWQHVLGCVVPVQSTVVDGVELSDIRAHMFLDGAKIEKVNDMVAMGCIAHEFAHVFLGHQCWETASKVFGDFEPLLWGAMKSCHEWDADLHVWLWGFHQEFRAWAKHGNKNHPPWWLSPGFGKQPELGEKTPTEKRGN